jgi:hypothetical protein
MATIWAKNMTARVRFQVAVDPGSVFMVPGIGSHFGKKE